MSKPRGYARSIGLNRRLRAALATDPEEWQRVLRRLARKYTRHDELVEDLASQVFLAAWREHDAFECDSVFSYLAQMMRYEYLNARRGKHFGGGVTDASLSKTRVSDYDCAELQNLSTPPTQVLALELQDTLRAIQKLPEQQREHLLCATYHESVKDAAKQLGMRPNTLLLSLNRARSAILGEVGERPKGVTKGRYRGVSKQGKHSFRWVAMISEGNAKRYLGCYDDPEEAATAYDIAAYARWGERAKLNFPEIIAHALKDAA